MTQVKKPVEYRLGILEKIKSIVCKDRMNVYSDAEDNFTHIRDRWKLYCKHRFGVEINFLPQDVAVMMCDVKITRISSTPGHLDSWYDLAGYGVCGAGNVEYKSAMDYNIESAKTNATTTIPAVPRHPGVIGSGTMADRTNLQQQEAEWTERKGQ